MAAPLSRAPNTGKMTPRGVVAIDYSGGDQSVNVPAFGVYIGTSGHLKVDMLDGSTGTFSNLPVGEWSMAITKIYQTGSTAAGLILY